MSRLLPAAWFVPVDFCDRPRWANQPDAGPLTNAAVVRLVKAGFKEKTVITIINNRANDFKARHRNT
jgi:hypothetical protein